MCIFISLYTKVLLQYSDILYPHEFPYMQISAHTSKEFKTKHCKMDLKKIMVIIPTSFDTLCYTTHSHILQFFYVLIFTTTDFHFVRMYFIFLTHRKFDIKFYKYMFVK